MTKIGEGERRADWWSPWHVRLEGAGYELHAREGVLTGRLSTQVRVWADGRARAIATGRDAAGAWFNLAMGLAGQAARAGTLGETDDACGDGACDPVPT
jgi:hypothetical protein